MPENVKSQNGFSVTGGKFNYSAEVRFPKTRDIARVKMTFKGLDTFDYLKASVMIEGTIPKLGKRGNQRNKVSFTCHDF